jgi:hypothetical protein
MNGMNIMGKNKRTLSRMLGNLFSINLSPEDKNVDLDSIIEKLLTKENSYTEEEEKNSLPKAKDSEESVDIEKIKILRKKGEELIREGVSSIQKAYEDKRATVFRISSSNLLQEGKYKFIKFTGEDKEIAVQYTTRARIYSVVLETFIKKLNETECNKASEDREAYIVAGELAMLQEAINNCSEQTMEDVKKIFKGLDKIKIMAGPLIVRGKNRPLNDFLSFLLDLKISNKVEFVKNQLKPFTNLYGGYFHWHSVGDVVLLELPHEFMHEGDSDNHIAIFEDKKYVEELKKFYKLYSGVVGATFEGQETFQSLESFYTSIDIQKGSNGENIRDILLGRNKSENHEKDELERMKLMIETLSAGLNNEKERRETIEGDMEDIKKGINRIVEALNVS